MDLDDCTTAPTAPKDRGQSVPTEGHMTDPCRPSRGPVRREKRELTLDSLAQFERLKREPQKPRTRGRTRARPDDREQERPERRELTTEGLVACEGLKHGRSRRTGDRGGNE